MKYVLLPLIFCLFALSTGAQNLDYNQPQDEGLLLLKYWESEIANDLQKNKTRFFKSTYLEFVVPEDMHKYNGLVGQILSVFLNIQPPVAHLLTNYLGSDLLFVPASQYEEALVRLKYMEKKFLQKQRSRLGFCSFDFDRYNSYELLDENHHRVLDSEELRKRGAYSTEAEQATFPIPELCKFEGSIRYRNCRVAFLYKGDKTGFVYEINGKVFDNYMSEKGAYDAMMSNLSCTGLK